MNESNESKQVVKSVRDLIAVPVPNQANEDLVRAEFDIQISTAMRYPRSLAKFVESATTIVTTDREVAASCCYSLPKKGKPEGASIRFAEIIAHCYKHLRIQSRIVSIDDEFVTAEGVCHDLENNVAISKQVKRRITDSDGKKYSADMIMVTANSASSISIRNAILSVVPAPLWLNIYKAAKGVAVGTAKELIARRREMFDAFGSLGVTPERIMRRMNVQGIEEIGLAELGQLVGIYTAVKEDMISIDEAFPREIPISTPLFKASEMIDVSPANAVTTEEQKERGLI